MTEAQILERLALYLAAEKKILEGNQSYTVAGVSYGRAELAQVRAEITRLYQELEIARTGSSYNSQSVVFGGRR